MRSLIQYGKALADFVFPRICCGCGERVVDYDLLVCDSCSNTLEDLPLPVCGICGCPGATTPGPSGCDDCPEPHAYFAAARGATVFSGLARTVVEKLKYNQRLEYAPFMAGYMAATMNTHWTSGSCDVIVPVPLHTVKKRDRGFNQSEVIASGLATHLKIPVVSNALCRDLATPSQTRLTRKQRVTNISGAFSCKHSTAIQKANILLVDDVYTTGATLNECARVLTEAGSGTIYCIAFARTPP